MTDCGVLSIVQAYGEGGDRGSTVGAFGKASPEEKISPIVLDGLARSLHPPADQSCPGKSRLHMYRCSSFRPLCGIKLIQLEISPLLLLYFTVYITCSLASSMHSSSRSTRAELLMLETCGPSRRAVRRLYVL